MFAQRCEDIRPIHYFLNHFSCARTSLPGYGPWSEYFTQFRFMKCPYWGIHRGPHVNPGGGWCLHCFGHEVIYLLTWLLIQVINFEKVTFVHYFIENIYWFLTILIFEIRKNPNVLFACLYKYRKKILQVCFWG